jgi:hypothetical protein
MEVLYLTDNLMSRKDAQVSALLPPRFAKLKNIKAGYESAEPTVRG